MVNFLRVVNLFSDVLKILLLAGILKTLMRKLSGRDTIYKGGSSCSDVSTVPLLAEALAVRMSMIHESGIVLW